MLCPMCDNTVSDTATVCPNCGAVTESIEFGTGGAVVVTNGANSGIKSAALIGGGLFILLAFIMLLVDPFNLHLLSRLTGRYDAAVHAMPPDTQTYVAVNLLAIDREKSLAIADTFKDAAVKAGYESDEEVNEFTREFEETLGISLDEDVLPWIGQYIGLGLSELSFKENGEPENISLVGAVEVRDKNAADDFLLKLAKAAGESNTHYVESQYQGVLIYENDSDVEHNRVALARSGNLLLVGSNVDAVKKSIDAQSGDSLAGAEEYKAVLDALPNKSDMTFYMDAMFYMNVLEAWNSGMAPYNASMNFNNQMLTGMNSMGAAASIVDAGLQIDYVTVYDPSQISEVIATMYSEQSANSLDELFPAETVIFTSGSNLNLLVEAMMDSLTDGPDEIDIEEAMQAFTEAFGFDLQKDLLSRLDGGYAFGIFGSAAGGMIKELSGIDLGYLLAFETSSSVAVAVDSFSHEIDNETPLDEIHSDTLTAYEPVLAPGQPPFVSYGYTDHMLLIGSSSGDLAEIVDRSRGRLADVELYQETKRYLPEKMVPSAYVDMASFFDIIEGGLGENQYLDFSTTVRPFIDPFTFVVSGLDYSQSGLVLGRAVIGIQTD